MITSFDTNTRVRVIQNMNFIRNDLNLSTYVTSTGNNICVAFDSDHYDWL